MDLNFTIYDYRLNTNTLSDETSFLLAGTQSLCLPTKLNLPIQRPAVGDEFQLWPAGLPGLSPGLAVGPWENGNVLINYSYYDK